MNNRRSVLVGLVVTVALTASTSAQPADPNQPPAAPQLPTAPPLPAAPPLPTAPQLPTADPTALPGDPLGAEQHAELTPPIKLPKMPKAGDFDAGGQVRFPNGPDETGHFATYNWIAVDLKGKVFVSRWLTVNATAPVAVKKPDMLMNGDDPKTFGGFDVRLEAKIPKKPPEPGETASTSELGVELSAGYMHEGAMLLSDKDYPKFIGNFEPGFTTGVIARLKLSSLLDFSLMPTIIDQSSPTGSQQAIQIPTAVIIKIGSLVRLSADLGIYTGAGYSLSGSGGGRISAGGSISVKIGPILAHAGAGAASLLTGGMYDSVGDSMYVDLNVKYVK
jgi:hypothetical protein